MISSLNWVRALCSSFQKQLFIFFNLHRNDNHIFSILSNIFSNKWFLKICLCSLLFSPKDFFFHSLYYGWITSSSPPSFSLSLTLLLILPLLFPLLILPFLLSFCYSSLNKLDFPGPAIYRVWLYVSEGKVLINLSGFLEKDSCFPGCHRGSV